MTVRAPAAYYRNANGQPAQHAHWFVRYGPFAAAHGEVWRDSRDYAPDQGYR